MHRSEQTDNRDKDRDSGNGTARSQSGQRTSVPISEGVAPPRHGEDAAPQVDLKPQATATTATGAAADAPADAAIGLPTVLVVDDNPSVAHALATLVRQAGFQAAVFYTGASAMAYLRYNKPAAAVIDIHLPDISGLILSQQVRQNAGPHVPVIILSGDNSMETLNSLPRVGATCFFAKPVRATHFVERLRELTSNVAANDQAPASARARA